MNDFNCGKNHESINNIQLPVWERSARQVPRLGVGGESNPLMFSHFTVNRKLIRGGVVVFYICHIYLGNTSVFISLQLV